MFFIIFSIFVGMFIGYMTNALAIKMLFRPYHAVKIGRWTLPFTPGLIPKRRSEIAEKLGEMVEGYLFTAEGLKQFIEKSKIKEQLFKKLQEKLTEYRNRQYQLGDVFKEVFHEDWKETLEKISLEELRELLSDPHLKKISLKDLLSDQMILQIDQEINLLADRSISELKTQLHSIEGKRFIDARIRQFIEGKGMLKIFAGFLFEGDSFQQKILAYLDQLLDHPDSKTMVRTLFLKEWDHLKNQPLEVWLIKYEDHFYREAEYLIHAGADKIENYPVNRFIDTMEKHRIIEKMYDLLILFIYERMDKLFGYLSVSKVVSEEVNRFSLIELEKMLLEISGREFKMITIFGGILGALVGLIQGIYLLFIQ